MKAQTNFTYGDLERWRSAAGITQKELAELFNCGLSKMQGLSRPEVNNRPLKGADALVFTILRNIGIDEYRELISKPELEQVTDIAPDELMVSRPDIKLPVSLRNITADDMRNALGELYSVKFLRTGQAYHFRMFLPAINELVDCSNPVVFGYSKVDVAKSGSKMYSLVNEPLLVREGSKQRPTADYYYPVDRPLVADEVTMLCGGYWAVNIPEHLVDLPQWGLPFWSRVVANLFRDVMIDRAEQMRPGLNPDLLELAERYGAYITAVNDSALDVCQQEDAFKEVTPQQWNDACTELLMAPIRVSSYKIFNFDK